MLAGTVSEIAKTKPTDNLEAYELYFLGTKSIENDMTREGHKKMEELYRKAIDKDPAFALPYMGLGWLEMRAY